MVLAGLQHGATSEPATAEVRKNPLQIYSEAGSYDPYGTRTRVAAVKGRSPRPLDEGAE